MKKRLVSILALSLTLIMCVLVFAGCTKKLDYEEYIADTQEAHDEYLKNHNERRGTAIIDGESFEFVTSCANGVWSTRFETDNDENDNIGVNASVVAPLISIHANAMENFEGATYARYAAFKGGEFVKGWEVEKDGVVFHFDEFTFLTEYIVDGETRVTIHW